MNKFLIITVILLVIELIYFKIADKYNIIDKPNLRSSHTKITLRGGGIIFLLSGWIYAAFFGFEYVWFLVGLTLIGGISFVDDVHSVPNKVRLVIQFAGMLLMFYQLGMFTLESWWIILVSLVVCTGIINAYNFMDGINGITGGYSLTVLVPLMLVNNSVEFVDVNLIYVVGLSVLVFCFFNFRTKAKCFAGDVGAVSIAFILLFMLGGLILKTGQVWYLIFFGIYGVDTILTIIHRLILKENIFIAHRKHAYQIMANELHIPHLVVSLIYMVLQGAVSLGAIYVGWNKWLYFGLVLGILCLAYILFMKKYFYLHKQSLLNK